MRRSSLAALACSLLVACEGGGGPSAFVIELVDAAGRSPLGDARTGTITVRVRQADATPVETSAEIANGTFVLDAPIQAELELDGERRIGALPLFVPFAYGSARLVVGAPATCAVLTEPVMVVAREHGALVPFDASLLAVGGLERDGAPSSRIDALVGVQLAYTQESSLRELTRLPDGVGRTRALRLARTLSMVVVSDERRFVVDVDPTHIGRFDRDLALHPGAGSESALVDLGDGVAIVGGASGDSAVRDISWVDSAGNVSTSRLRFARRGASAARVGAGILVAGGQAEGEPLYEWFLTYPPEARDDVVTFGDTTAVSRPTLVPNPGRDVALLVGGTLADASVRSATQLVYGCPTSCTVDAGPVWEAPRTELALVEREADALLIGGRDAAGPVPTVERVVYAAATPRIESHASLGSARAQPAAAPLASGVVLVAGGRGLDGALATLELCFPPELDAL